MAKGKKKGGKKKGEASAGPVPETTRQILRERERCMCPRLGDATVRAARADMILKDCVQFKIRRAATTEACTSLDLSRAHLPFVPEELRRELCGEDETSSSSNDRRADIFDDGEDEAWERSGLVQRAIARGTHNKKPPASALRSRLTAIDLSRNQLFGSEHVFEALGELATLTSLDLSRNFLNGPLSAKIKNFPNLERLLLGDNQLTALPDTLGTDLPRMRHFVVAKNALTRVPESLREWHRLVTFDARSNAITSLQWTTFPDLEALYLGSNELVDFELNAPSLTELDLRRNKLAAVPPALRESLKLKRLHLGDNRLTEVPDDFFVNLGELEELHLYKNKLDVLPDDVGSLAKCKSLTLSSTNLKTLPESISACASLEELYLNNCAKFTGLPAASGSLTNLKELQAKKCPALKALPSTAVAWRNLKELDLRAAKKQVCKLQPEQLQAFAANNCTIRGGVQKGGGKKGKS